MKFEINKIEFAGSDETPKIAVKVSFREDKQLLGQSGTVNVLIEYQDFKLSEIKTAAVKAAKELLANAANAELK